MAQQVSGRQPRYKRILLKLSGEALMGSEDFGIDPKVLDRMALEVGQLVGIGVEVGLVIGGGNLFRGAALSARGTPFNTLAAAGGAPFNSDTRDARGSGPPRLSIVVGGSASKGLRSAGSALSASFDSLALGLAMQEKA